jgi:ankyrin repeat protein
MYNANSLRFLLARSHMRSLAFQIRPADVRNKLKSLPDDTDKMYEEALTRIEEMTTDDPKRKLAFDVLSWVVHSLRPLSICELQHALAVLPGSVEFDRGRIFLREDILAVCGGLITIDEDVVRLVHYTTQTYFSKVGESKFAGFHTVIAQTCATYLSLRDLEQPDDQGLEISFVDDLYGDPEEMDDEFGYGEPYNMEGGPITFASSAFSAVSETARRLTFRTKCRRFPFVKYAAAHLGQHLQHIPNMEPDDTTLETVCNLLRCQPKKNFLARMLFELNLEVPATSDNLFFHTLPRPSPQEVLTSTAYSPITAANIPDAADAVQRIGSEEADGSSTQSDEDGYDSEEFELEMILHTITYADRVVESQSDEEDDDGYSLREDDTASDERTVPFDTASSADETSSTRKLSNTSPPLRSTPRFETLALHLACFLGHAALVEIFATESSDIDALDLHSQTALQIAIARNNFDAATILLTHGACVDILEKETHAMLLYAAQQGDSNFVLKVIAEASSVLLDNPRMNRHGIIISILHTAWSLLIWLPVFLWHGVFGQQTTSKPPNADDMMERGHVNVPELLTSSDLRFLQAAAIGDCATIKSMIGEGKVKLRSQSSFFYNTALFLAIEFGSGAVLKELLDGGANLNVYGIGRATPLHRAVFLNNMTIVELLLEHKPDLDMRDCNGETAWAANATPSHTEGESYTCESLLGYVYYMLMIAINSSKASPRCWRRSKYPRQGRSITTLLSCSRWPRQRCPLPLG